MRDKGGRARLMGRKVMLRRSERDSRLTLLLILLLVALLLAITIRFTYSSAPLPVMKKDIPDFLV